MVDPLDKWLGKDQEDSCLFVISKYNGKNICVICCLSGIGKRTSPAIWTTPTSRTIPLKTKTYLLSCLIWCSASAMSLSLDLRFPYQPSFLETFNLTFTNVVGEIAVQVGMKWFFQRLNFSLLLEATTTPIIQLGPSVIQWFSHCPQTLREVRFRLAPQLKVVKELTSFCRLTVREKSDCWNWNSFPTRGHRIQRLTRLWSSCPSPLSLVLTFFVCLIEIVMIDFAKKFSGFLYKYVHIAVRLPRAIAFKQCKSWAVVLHCGFPSWATAFGAKQCSCSKRAQAAYSHTTSRVCTEAMTRKLSHSGGQHVLSKWLFPNYSRENQPECKMSTHNYSFVWEGNTENR